MTSKPVYVKVQEVNESLLRFPNREDYEDWVYTGSCLSSLGPHYFIKRWEPDDDLQELEDEQLSYYKKYIPKHDIPAEFHD